MSGGVGEAVHPRPPEYTFPMLLLLLACTGGTPDADSGTPYVGPDDTAEPGTFAIALPAATSSAGHALEDRCAWQLDVAYECRNGNPEVVWTDPPAGTVAYALIFDDPDAGDYEHWAIVNIPVSYNNIDASTSGDGLGDDLPGGAYELENGFGFPGYLGSCPPEAHVYRWRVWALGEELEAGLERFAQVERQAEERALGMAETCHIYGPKSE